MRVFRHDKAEGPDRGAVVAIGNFDGVHPGHQAVIAQAGGIARGLHIPHAVLTFDPHPFGVFKPDAPPFRLTPFRAKARLIETLGVDLLFVIHFDLDFAKREPAEFVDRVLIEGLGARHVVVGYDFVLAGGGAAIPGCSRNSARARDSAFPWSRPYPAPAARSIPRPASASC